VVFETSVLAVFSEREEKEKRWVFVLEDKVVALTQFHPMHLGFILASILSLMSFSLSKFYGIPPERLSLEASVLRYLLFIP